MQLKYVILIFYIDIISPCITKQYESLTDYFGTSNTWQDRYTDTIYTPLLKELNSSKELCCGPTDIMIAFQIQKTFNLSSDVLLHIFSFIEPTGKTVLFTQETKQNNLPRRKLITLTDLDNQSIHNITISKNSSGYWGDFTRCSLQIDPPINDIKLLTQSGLVNHIKKINKTNNDDEKINEVTCDNFITDIGSNFIIIKERNNHEACSNILNIHQFKSNYTKPYIQIKTKHHVKKAFCTDQYLIIETIDEHIFIKYFEWYNKGHHSQYPNPTSHRIEIYDWIDIQKKLKPDQIEYDLSLIKPLIIKAIPLLKAFKERLYGANNDSNTFTTISRTTKTSTTYQIKRFLFPLKTSLTIPIIKPDIPITQGIHKSSEIAVKITTNPSNEKPQIQDNDQISDREKIKLLKPTIPSSKTNTIEIKIPTPPVKSIIPNHSQEDNNDKPRTRTFLGLNKLQWKRIGRIAGILIITTITSIIIAQVLHKILFIRYYKPITMLNY